MTIQLDLPKEKALYEWRKSVLEGVLRDVLTDMTTYKLSFAELFINTEHKQNAIKLLNLFTSPVLELIPKLNEALKLNDFLQKFGVKALPVYLQPNSDFFKLAREEMFIWLYHGDNDKMNQIMKYRSDYMQELAFIQQLVSALPSGFTLEKLKLTINDIYKIHVENTNFNVAMFEFFITYIFDNCSHEIEKAEERVADANKLSLRKLVIQRHAVAFTDVFIQTIMPNVHESAVKLINRCCNDFILQHFNSGLCSMLSLRYARNVLLDDIAKNTAFSQFLTANVASVIKSFTLNLSTYEDICLAFAGLIKFIAPTVNIDYNVIHNDISALPLADPFCHHIVFSSSNVVLYPNPGDDPLMNCANYIHKTADIMQSLDTIPIDLNAYAQINRMIGQKWMILISLLANADKNTFKRNFIETLLFVIKTLGINKEYTTPTVDGVDVAEDIVAAYGGRLRPRAQWYDPEMMFVISDRYSALPFLGQQIRRHNNKNIPNYDTLRQLLRDKHANQPNLMNLLSTITQQPDIVSIFKLYSECNDTDVRAELVKALKAEIECALEVFKAPGLYPKLSNAAKIGYGSVLPYVYQVGYMIAHEILAGIIPYTCGSFVGKTRTGKSVAIFHSAKQYTEKELYNYLIDTFSSEGNIYVTLITGLLLSAKYNDIAMQLLENAAQQNLLLPLTHSVGWTQLQLNDFNAAMASRMYIGHAIVKCVDLSLPPQDRVENITILNPSLYKITHYRTLSTYALEYRPDDETYDAHADDVTTVKQFKFFGGGNYRETLVNVVKMACLIILCAVVITVIVHFLITSPIDRKDEILSNSHDIWK